MRSKLDENLPLEMADVLNNAGHDATTVTAQGMNGTADPNVMQVCIREQRALVTMDLDFSDVRAYPPQEHNGIVVFRLRSQDKTNLLKTARQVLPLFEQEELRHTLWIVDEERLRIRGGHS